jgi:hypothetical protein
MKRLLLLAMLALTTLSASYKTNIQTPLPECDACPIAR